MLKRIRVSQLQVGMYIEDMQGSASAKQLWPQGFLLQDERTLDRIRDSGVREVWIETSRGEDVVEEEPVALASVQAANPSASRPAAPVEQVSVEAELKRAAQICNQAKSAVTTMFQEARLGKAVNIAAAKGLVEDLSDSVSRNAQALISLARLKTADDYTYMHSVAVAAMMIALARQLNLNEDQVRSAGLAGLLHDMGKAAIPLNVLNKPGKLTDKEFAIVKSHPEEGHKMLQMLKDADPIALDVCLHHHEKTDGTGYPAGLSNGEISLFAKMGAVCDVYDAITSNRPYKAGWDPAESLRKMNEWTNGHFDPVVFKAFVKSLGIYPIGSLVRLSSERLGVVVGQSPTSLTAPKVKVFYHAQKGHLKPEVVNLAAPDAQDKIVGLEDPGNWQMFNLNQLWAGEHAPAMAA